MVSKVIKKGLLENGTHPILPQKTCLPVYPEGLLPAGRYLTDWSTIALSTGWGCFQAGRMYMAYLF
jgi:hypothetical protein